MTAANQEVGELRQSYRTLNEPTKLLGLSLAAWAAVICAGAAAYAFVAVSPLPWRFNFSVVVVGLGAPVGLVVLREPGTIGPGRLLVAVLMWRLRPAAVIPVASETPVRRGGVRLDTALEATSPEGSDALPWATHGGEGAAR